ncbi:TIGR01212 family radical SAM protein [Paradesulfitobacterium ferrireducens]|uniref:TIGR01212 family radical SAM protein n=1 Tax=Paradesulfitobacterium ferrireducens TaxID=2816476 RepID=UPI001A9077A3|nr:TIGR01212 family radical SAM protein [Paradesulfitobacterium ferrireducens]
MNEGQAVGKNRWGNKRYHTFNAHLRETFGEKIIKVSLDAGFTCPNRDGTRGWGGCVYCSERGSGDFAGAQTLSIPEQFAQVKERMHLKWPKAKYLAYFQAYSNTYAPVARLREVYEQALAEKDVIGLALATRPDCLPPEVLSYLEELNRRTYLWVELGLQSMHDRTLAWIRRGHNYREFLEGYHELKKREIRVCVHIILGLPGETRAQMLETAKALAGLKVEGVKIHLLHVLRGTPLALIYEKEKFPLLTKEEYVSLVADVLEILPPDMIIHRLTGDGPPEQLIAPLWSRKKWEVLNAIDAELERRDSWQGKYAKQIK